MTVSVTLAITTSGPVGVAVLVGEDEHTIASVQPALAGTLPSVIAALQSARVGLSEVELLAVCIGPGSFTGLRIGAAFAKSVAQARGIPIVGVSAYDVAEYGLSATAFPRAAIVQGKRDYFYARIRTAAGTAPKFLRGTADELAGPLEGHTQVRLPEVPAADRAVRVARIGRQSLAQGAESDWRRLAIDYGQRPNAELNWEARHRAQERGGAASAAKLTRR
jgi:tRNA threonylcarbamoyl adenosine modification protein YeaZ